jgi:prevent-host-death family protein
MATRALRYVNIAEAKARLSELVEKAASGEEIVIARDHKPVAKLVPVRSDAPRVPGSAKTTNLDRAGFRRGPGRFLRL